MDWRNPDYTAVFEARQKRLLALSSDPQLLAASRIHYATHPWDFVDDWGMTFDPRQLERGRLANVPFVLWDKQREYLQWLYERWQAGERGLVEKSRDCGVTWLSVGFAVALWATRTGVAIGFGSRKESLVDTMGDPDSIFEKVRHMVQHLPPILLPDGFRFSEHSAYMRVHCPTTGSSITGEAGDNIGRGGRKAIYFVDESSFLERQEVVEKALSQTTNCRIDVSTFNGSGNLFYRNWQKFAGTRRHFVFDWRDDPRKDDAWYARQLEELDEETVAQEIDRDPLASNTDAFIPAKWVAAAIDAHIALDFEPSGQRVTGFDPADVGDAKAVVHRHGSIVMQARTMPGRGDITQAIPWAYHETDMFRADQLLFDGDGMGAPTMKQAFTTMIAGEAHIEMYCGSAAVVDPDQVYGENRYIWSKNREQRADDSRQLSGKTNKDTFVNYRAQTWTWVRDRFRATYEAVTRAREGQVVNVDPEYLISISSECEALDELRSELSRPQRHFTNNGKIKVESKADMKRRGVASPNLADALVMAFSKVKRTDVEVRVFQTTPTVGTRQGSTVGYTAGATGWLSV